MAAPPRPSAQKRLAVVSDRLATPGFSESMRLPTPMFRAVELVFLGHMTDQEIADTIGVAARTLARWKGREDFQTALAEFSQASRRRALDVLDATVDKAARTLRDLLDSESEQIRLRAAVEVLKLTDTVVDVSPAPRTHVEVQVANFFQQLVQGPCN